MKKFFTILALSAALVATSCNKWLDINTNPNYVGEADMAMLMPTIQLMTADKVGYELSLYGSFWAQYVVQNANTNQYYTIMTNDVTNSTFTSPWTYFYASVLPRIREVVAKAEEKGNASNYTLEAKAMLAYSLYLLTSLYGDVAYTEGYLKETQTPKFDSAQEMQGIIIALCEEIRAMDAAKAAADEVQNVSVSSDMVFGGDTDAWFQFVNTLYLKVLLRDFTANKTKIQNLLAEDNFLAQDAAFDNFANEANKSNPFYESDRRQLNTDANIRCCSDVLNVLSATDPRLKYYYDENPGGVVMGAPYGQTVKPESSSRLALYPTEAVYFSTVDEALFLQAEAYARLNNAVAAAAAYDAAVKAAFVRVGCKAADATALLATSYLFVPGTVESMVEQVINQKWASNVHGLPWESWFDLNRTGYPTRGTTITNESGVLAAGNYPRRFIYSKTSADYNPNSPAPLAVDEKMWWHK
ncbi:MAG: SusD/RagB family nutrient-binding outer membrane lipoprotein [Bacteroidales bacterium]|nr:SusD/RagB family nutrient-binding outer membrane lipoprotein [Bacteroidales bacterium]